MLYKGIKMGAIVVTLLLIIGGLGVSYDSAKQPSNRNYCKNVAYYVAQREVRRCLDVLGAPDEVQERVYQLPAPEVKWHDHLIGPKDFGVQDEGRIAYGFYNLAEGKLVHVALTPDEREDFNSLIHEDMHYITENTRLPEEAVRRINAAVDLEYSLGSK